MLQRKIFCILLLFLSLFFNKKNLILIGFQIAPLNIAYFLGCKVLFSSQAFCYYDLNRIKI